MDRPHSDTVLFDLPSRRHDATLLDDRKSELNKSSGDSNMPVKTLSDLIKKNPKKS